jgi:hypothetical protein
MNKKSIRKKNLMIRFEPGPEACNGYFQISWTPSKIDSKQQLIHACKFLRGDFVWPENGKFIENSGNSEVFLLEEF